MVMIESYDADSSISEEHAKCCCFNYNIRTAPLYVSIVGMSISVAFMVFYVLHHEFILLFPLITMFACHFCMLLGNRLRRAKFYSPIVYLTNFLITMLTSAMLFYVYVIVGDAKRRPMVVDGTETKMDLWTAFRSEIVRVLVAVALIAFALAHRAVLQVVKMDDANLQYERFQQRTATIYSLASECHSRAGEEALTYKLQNPLTSAPYLSTIISASYTPSFTSSNSSSSLSTNNQQSRPLIREMV
ncbi:hypothetical protein M3Y94_00878200 [Aphelenchoides besseyi]|nr:hypothetical protein M3Y94_00878200 [Aphelenchoides besseyi]KAI6226584.1 hypothetical protein M3Y95_00636300 [Aphelenchoides besseyi]